MPTQEVIQVVQTLGVPVAILAALGLAIWKAFRWAAPIVHELAMKHGSLVDKLQEYLDSTSETLGRQATHLESQHGIKIAKLQEIHTEVRGIAVDVKDIKEKVRH